MLPTKARPVPTPPILLAVCTTAPWPVANGYTLRVFHQLQQLSAKWQIKLIAPRPAKGIDMFPADIAEYIPVDLQGPGVLHPWRFDQTELRATVNAAILKHSPNRALVWCGAEGIWINSPDLPPAVFDEVDCTSFWLWQSLAWKQSLRARIGTVKELAISAWFARRTVRRFSCVICAGETDARWLRWIGGRSSVEVVSNGVALPDLGRGYESTDSVPKSATPVLCRHP